MNSYSVKFFLHCTTLFPTMYLQAKGTSVYKKFSFQIAKKDFKDNLWSPIVKAEELRRNWKPLKTLPFIGTMAEVNPLLWYQLNSRAFNISKLNNINTKYLIEGMYRLSDHAWSKVKRELK